MLVRMAGRMRAHTACAPATRRAPCEARSLAHRMQWVTADSKIVSLKESEDPCASPLLACTTTPHFVVLWKNLVRVRAHDNDSIFLLLFL